MKNKILNKKPYFVAVCIQSAAALLQFSDFYFQHVSGWKVFKAMLIMITLQECQKSWKLHGLTLQNVTPLDQSLKKGEKMFVQKLSLGSFGLLRFFFEVEFMGQLNFFLAPIVFFLCCSTYFPCFAIVSIVCKKPNFCSKKYLEKSKLIFRPKIQG